MLVAEDFQIDFHLLAGEAETTILSGMSQPVIRGLVSIHLR